jgi:hypothetical protein
MPKLNPSFRLSPEPSTDGGPLVDMISSVKARIPSQIIVDVELTEWSRVGCDVQLIITGVTVMLSAIS